MNHCVTKDPETGEVKHDAEKCVGCWMCVMVCPYGAVTTGGKTMEEHGVAIRCDLCEGEEQPLCALVCPTGAVVCVESEVESMEKAGAEIRE
jgi:carbon-monoxide dehydrogenase iron sulfur subunit